MAITLKNVNSFRQVSGVRCECFILAEWAMTEVETLSIEIIYFTSKLNAKSMAEGILQPCGYRVFKAISIWFCF